MRRINVNLYPKDGYFFTESDKSVHRAANWRAVIKRVIEYRQRASLPAGDPEREVMMQACTRSPNLCYEDSAVAVPKPGVSLKAKVMKWLDSFVRIQQRDGLEYVPPAEASARAGICAACPKNQSLGVKSCSTCKQALSEYRKTLLGGSRARDGRLGGCAVLTSDLVTAVHLDEVRIENAALPANCWRKKTI